MKKIFNTLALALALNLAYAQSLSVAQTNLTITGMASDFELISYMDVTNNSGSNLQVKVKRQVNSESAGTQNAICWVQCYIPSVGVSPDAIEIPAGGTAGNFSGHFYPNGATDAVSADIDYIFYDVNNPDDSAVLNVVYQASPLGLASESKIHSTLYPNPSSGNVFVDCSAATSQLRLVVYDVLGNAVKNVQLSGLTGRRKIDLSTLRQGVYFYQFIVDGRSEETRRLVITR